MLKKTIKYTDFNDQEKETEFHFHLSQAKIIRWNMLYVKDDGLKGHLERVMREQDGEAIFNFIEKMILDSYGKKRADGGFDQTPEIRQEFESSAAYSKLLMELISDADGAAAFLNAIIPSGLEAELQQMIANNAAAEQRQPNRAERRHPSDTAAQTPPPGPRPAVSLEQRIHAAEPPQPPVQREPIVLTREQLIEMDDAELRSGLAEGRYKLQ